MTNLLSHVNYGLLLDKEDSRPWTLCKDSEFSVKSCLPLFAEEVVHEDMCKKLWKLNVPSKVQIFLWAACGDRLPTIDNLQKRGMYIPNVYSLCYKNAESVHHIFIHCEYASEVLARGNEGSGCGLGLSLHSKGSLQELEFS